MLNRSILAVAVFASLAVPSFAAEVELRETACRLLDTRHIGGYNSGSKVTSMTIEATDPDLDDVAFTVSGRDYNYQGGEAGCRVPAGAQGAMLNVVLFSPNSVGNATLWPYGVPQPLSTSINSNGSLNEVAGLKVTLGTDGRIELNSTITGAHYIADFLGVIDGGGAPGVEAPRHRRFHTWTNAPFAPGALSAGDRFLVAESGGVGAFAGHEGEWAVWNGEAWDFEPAADGDLAYEASSGKYYRYKGLGSAEWSVIGPDPEAPVAAAWGTVTAINIALPGGGGPTYQLTLDSGVRFVCDDQYMTASDCSTVVVGDRVVGAGHVKNFFGGIYLFAHGQITINP